MTFHECLTQHCNTPAKRLKLVTLRSLWNAPRDRTELRDPDGFGVDLEAFEARMVATNPSLVTFTQDIIATGNLSLDAVLLVPMRIPLNREPIRDPMMTH
ncbi:hypothetical protein [Pseudomonas sp. Irchel s3f19]|uniref:hypothetical protein n=1 Tax=Pseudomonas sp. Irchel s3f19 TaxID=2009146 RepID=UPI000BA344F5|nr:hypothetical protein [Pseudomonas sp. Irchel s3f19]